MARVYYGVWDGAVKDNRGKNLFEIEETPELKGFDVFNQGNPIRAFIGDRGFYVFDRHVSLTDAFWRYMEKAADESCGKCTPCRVGSHFIRDELDALRKGQGGPERWDAIQTLAEQIHATSLCGLGHTSVEALLSALKHFRDELLKGGGRAAPEQYGMTYVTSPCIEACPAKVNVPRYIDYIKDGQPEHSLGVILQKYPMAATCGRVCVRFCELACQRSKVDEPVGIKTLKRYVADQEKHIQHELFSPELITSPQSPDLRVAVVGAGPGGVSCAYHLLLKGYPVDVLEAKQEAGGMAACGIPSYRLPKDVLKSETDIIERLGGRVLYGQALGKDFSLNQLFAQGYKAVFLALGCSQGKLLGVPDEDPTLDGYVSGIDFLLQAHEHAEGVKLMRITGDVIVVGGGNVAMDCVRSALRMGASSVRLVYRRTTQDMPADHEEIEAAEKEGVIFDCLTNPTRVLSENGRVLGVELTRMRQTAPDARGRRNVEPAPGSEFEAPCQLLIAAIGQQVDKDALKPEDGVLFNKWGYVEADQTTLATARPGVFAGGDCFLGPSTLIHAMANGLKAARSIDDYLQYGRVRFFPRSRMRQLINEYKVLAKEWIDTPVEHKYRVEVQELDPELRKKQFEEVEQTISSEEAYREAERCLRCYRVYSVLTESPIPEGCR